MNQPDAATQQFEQLMERPDIEQATGHYEQMYDTIRKDLATIVPSLHWEKSDDLITSGCGHEFGAIDVAGRSDAAEHSLPNHLARGPVPDEQWDQAVAAVDRISRGYGFNSGPVVVKNNPPDHYVAFYDSYGAKLTLGSAVNTGMTLRTGCHLTPEAKQRGELSPTRTY